MELILNGRAVKVVEINLRDGVVIVRGDGQRDLLTLDAAAVASLKTWLESLKPANG